VFDVIALLRRTIEVMPEEDAQACDVSDWDQPPFMVAGWPDQLGFAFRSMLGYLLIRRRPRSKVRVEIRYIAPPRAEILTVVLSVALGRDQSRSAAATPSDPIAAAEYNARLVAELAPEAIGLAVARHDGEFFQRVHRRGRLILTTTLPSAQLGVSRAGS
jgi:hypothetical protein